MMIRCHGFAARVLTKTNSFLEGEREGILRPRFILEMVVFPCYQVGKCICLVMRSPIQVVLDIILPYTPKLEWSPDDTFERYY